MSQNASSSQPRWYVLQTKPCQEARALEVLRSQQYSCFLPIHRNKKSRSEAHCIAGEPLFSRYLFVQLTNVESEGAEVQRLDGISRLLKLNNRFVTVPDAVISALLNLNPAHARGEVEGGADRSVAPSVMEILHELPDGVARALTLIEMICRPQKAVVAPARLPEAA